MTRRFICVIACSLAAVVAWAQDTRSVSEPLFPPVCAQLKARLVSTPATGLAPAFETSYDTPAIQSALNLCPAGQAVELATDGAADAFLMAPIRLRAGVTLLVGSGATVFASRNPSDYDNGSHSCGTITPSGGGCLPLITANRSDGAGLMGYGMIDGRGYLPMLVNGTPSAQSWWDLANQANGTGMSQNCPRMVQVSNTNGFTIYKITLKNSPNFHVALGTDTNFTAWGVKIVTPYDARNTDGIDPGYSRNVTITASHISTGDDNVAVGASSNPGASNISVVDNWFGDGHGASIGSYTQAGARNVLFDGITFAGDSANSNQIGIRIKSDVSRGGLVEHITYSNMCMQNVRNAIVLDPFYTSGATGSLVPSYQDITIRNVHATTEGKVKIYGHDDLVATTIALDNVQIDGIKASDVTVQYSKVTLGPGAVNFGALVKGTGVSVTDNTAGAAAPYGCPAAIFSPIMGELIPGPPRVTAGRPFTIQAQVITTKAVPYQQYLARLKTDPTATLALATPTGTVTLYDGAVAIGTVALTGGSLVAIPVAGLRAGRHELTAAYSGDANYAPITFGSYQVDSVRAHRPRRFR